MSASTGLDNIIALLVFTLIWVTSGICDVSLGLVHHWDVSEITS